MNALECTKILKALGEDTRIQIFEMLRNGKLCACNILDKFNITQPTLSHHMKILCDAGIVVGRKEGKWTHYRLSAEGRDRAVELLKQLTTPYAEQQGSSSTCESERIAI